MSKIVGILGGMGPYSTMDFVHKILLNTPVRIEQDHLRLLIYNNPKIPSRIDALTPGKESPLQELIQTARALERAGAHFIMMPCHSAHYWMDEIKQAISIPFHSIIQCVEEYFQSEDKGERVLLLASETTIQSGLYQTAFERLSSQLLVPEPSEQNQVNDVIRYLKLNPSKIESVLSDINKILVKYKEKKVKKVIGGCTEIPLISSGLDKEIEFIDPTLLLALKAVKIACK